MFLDFKSNTLNVFFLLLTVSSKDDSIFSNNERLLLLFLFFVLFFCCFCFMFQNKVLNTLLKDVDLDKHV
jgi:hypothetical protein